MREMSPDRPDKTDCPFTVDAGHFQLEMDFANFTYDAPNSEHGNVKSEDYQIAPMNLKVGVLQQHGFSTGAGTLAMGAHRGQKRGHSRAKIRLWRHHSARQR